jgi:inner membrane protein
LGKNHLLVGASTGLLLYNTKLMQTGLYQNDVSTILGGQLSNLLNNTLLGNEMNHLLHIAAGYKLDAFAGIILGSLIIDLDSDNSIISRRIMPIKNNKLRSTCLYGLGILLLMAPGLLFKYIGAMILLGRLCRKVKHRLEFEGMSMKYKTLEYHRTIFHSLLGLVLNILPIAYIEMKTGLFITIPFILGAALHLLCDCFSVYGIALFYPFSKKHFKMPITYKMSYKENIMEFLIVKVYVALVVVYTFDLMQFLI